MQFDFTSSRIDPNVLRVALEDRAAGGYASFEGWVRDHNEGLAVTRLEYEAFELLARKEGERIVREAIKRFDVINAACVHRVGSLEIGELAVWVGVSARHRAEAFAACRYIIDEVKHRVPIWKKEHYVNGDSGWVNCERCAEHAHGHGHEHGHSGRPDDRTTGHTHEHRHVAQVSGPQPPASRLQCEGAPALSRYSRQIALKEVGAAGQAKLQAARVLVVGAGGLGVPVLTTLAGAGVGTLGIVEHDTVDLTNLHRQTLFATSDVHRLKIEVAAERLRALNPDVNVVLHAQRFDADSGDLLAGYDLVIDCTDNFTTKFAINDAAVRARKPAIFASVYQYEGQLQVYRPAEDSACLRCLWPEATRDGLVGNCAEAGVLGPVPALFGSLQALEALKLLLDLPGQLRGSLLLIDLMSLEQRKVTARRCGECRDGPCVRIPAASQTDYEIEIADLARAKKLDLHLIDIRDANEVAESPLPQVRHIPMSELLAEPQQLERDGKYLLVCARGMRSRGLAAELRSRGFRNVFSLTGGVVALNNNAQEIA